MAEETIIQNLISQLGQSQDERMPAELRPRFVDVEERAPRDLLLFAGRLAKLVRFYGYKVQDQEETLEEPQDWEPFFPVADEASAARLLEDSSSATPPHLALLVAFLRLYDRFPRQTINRITGRHLDFYYRRVLRFERKPPVPDRAHVVIELKKGSPPVLVTPGHRFSAGKTAAGTELLYAPTRETVIGSARIDSLRSIFVKDGRVRFAPIANSSDGLGGELPGGEPGWNAFGHKDLPEAPVGFALGSPALRMAEGHRSVKLSLHLAGFTSLSGTLKAFVTGEKGWLGPYVLTPEAKEKDEWLHLSFKVPPGDPAVTDYDPAVHGHSYRTAAPVLQVLLEPGSAGYDALKGLTLSEAMLSVDVSGITSLTLESDAGRLDPKKAFLPFGPQPAVGSRFLVGCAEALSKKLTDLTLTIQWQGAPANFATHYANYGVSGVGNSYFTASVSFEDAGTWKEQRRSLALFAPRTPEGERSLTFGRGGSSIDLFGLDFSDLFASLRSGSFWVPKPRSGFITLALEREFLHETYRRKTIENALKYGKQDEGDPIVLNEPYTPVIQDISLSYKAQTGSVSIESDSREAFANPDIQFFHAGCFGQMREHGYQRSQLAFVASKAVPLFPQYDNEGEFLVGLTGLRAGDSVSVLFQAAEGSADPGLKRFPVEWHVLCDNYWKKMESREVVLDTTNQLHTSGIITFVIPREATTENTILPAGRIWLKAAVSKNVEAVSRLVAVAANAVEVARLDAGADPSHLSAALPKGKIAKLKTPISAVKAIAQPFASFGGRPVETEAAFNTRVAERLRHKNRCITPWDYERVVLEAFPGVHKVKCVPHAKDGSWLAPGHVLVVVVPDLRNQNARDRLRPRVDSDTIERIRMLLQERAGMQAAVHVKNPEYQKIRLDFRVRFHDGFEPNYHKVRLREELIRFLSPWAHDASRPISFGGRVYKSVLLDFVDELGYVDYVTDFKMHSFIGDKGDVVDPRDLNEVRAQRPDAILVSDSEHVIEAL